MVFAEETSVVLNKNTQAQNKPSKTKSRTKSKKQGKKSTTRNMELG